MDISFHVSGEKFNYRVCGILVSDGKILAMKDERSPCYYLPGGRVALGETAEQAVCRELREELAVEARIVRPLWLHQSFYTEEVDHLRYHELCLYFLTEAPALSARSGVRRRGGRPQAPLRVAALRAAEGRALLPALPEGRDFSPARLAHDIRVRRAYPRASSSRIISDSDALR